MERGDDMATKEWTRAEAGVKGDWAWGQNDSGGVAFRAAQAGVTLFVIKGPTITPGGPRVSLWVRDVVDKLLALGLEATGFAAAALIETARDAYAERFEWSDSDLTGAN